MKNKYTKEAQKIIDNLKNKSNEILSNENIDFIYSLKDRWADEKEYEDFKDYQEAIKKKTGLLISKGFKFKIKESHMTLTISFNNRSITSNIDGILETDIVKNYL